MIAQSWLALQCRMIAGVARGVLLLGPADHGPFRRAAQWPPSGTESAPLNAAAEAALAARSGVVHGVEATGNAGGTAHDCVACPVLLDGKLFGVVAVELTARPEGQRQAVAQLLHWGTTWLQVLMHQQTAVAGERLFAVLEMVAACLEHERYQAAATAVVNQLAARLGCARVSLGFIDGRHVRVATLSHSAEFGKRINLIRDIGGAMDEAVALQATIVHPPADAKALSGRAHAELARLHDSATVCTVPLAAHGRVLGALTLERGEAQPFDTATVEMCEYVGALVGPVLDLKRRDERALHRKVTDAARGQWTKLLGPHHALAKLGTAGAVLLAAVLAFAQGDYRVTGDATLEGSVQRVLVAPIDGYIATAWARAGDIVHAGDQLGSLDDKDLNLERLKLASQREQLVKESRNALANSDRAQVTILNAQIAQADAQIALLDEQRTRTRIVAPFDGIIVSGDLSQSLGSPVERGQTLFQIAPLDAYRIILQIDEREIVDIAVGQQGRLALAAIPGEEFPFRVRKITPVSVAADGRNHFRAEAQLDAASELLRPGMEGVGKIHIERRNLLWIWTHKLVDWARLWLWAW